MSDASLCVFGVTAIACDLLDGRLETVLRLDDMLRGPHGMGLAIVGHGGKVFAAELGSDHVVTIRSPLGDTWPDVGTWTAIDRGRWSGAAACAWMVEMSDANHCPCGEVIYRGVAS